MLRYYFSFFCLLKKEILISKESIPVKIDDGLSITLDTQSKTGFVGLDIQFQSSSGKETGEINIPSAILYENESYIINKIGSYAFYETQITKIYLPYTIKYIGEYAFYNCHNLVIQIDTGTSLESVEKYAFFGNQIFNEINFLQSVSFIGDGAFSECNSLTKIDYGYSFTEILTNVCENSQKLEEIQLSPQLKFISPSAFWNLPALKRFSTSYNNYLVFIDTNGALYHRESLSKPFSLIKCPSLLEISEEMTFSFKNDIESISSYAFYGCNNIKSSSLQIPDSVKEIKEFAFFGGYKIKKIFNSKDF